MRGRFCLKIHSCLKITRIQSRRRLADSNYSVVAPKDIFAPRIVAVHGVAASTFVEVYRLNMELADVRFGSLAATRPGQRRGCFTPESRRGTPSAACPPGSTTDTLTQSLHVRFDRIRRCVFRLARNSAARQRDHPFMSGNLAKPNQTSFMCFTISPNASHCAGLTK